MKQLGDATGLAPITLGNSSGQQSAARSLRGIYSGGLDLSYYGTVLQLFKQVCLPVAIEKSSQNSIVEVRILCRGCYFW